MSYTFTVSGPRTVGAELVTMPAGSEVQLSRHEEFDASRRFDTPEQAI